MKIFFIRILGTKTKWEYNGPSPWVKGHWIGPPGESDWGPSTTESIQQSISEASVFSNRTSVENAKKATMRRWDAIGLMVEVVEFVEKPNG